MGKGKGKPQDASGICKFHARGSCRLGDSCPYRHEPAVAETAAVSVAAVAMYVPWNESPPQPCTNNRHPLTQPTGKQPTNRPTQTGQPTNKFEKRPQTGLVGPKTPTNWSKTVGNNKNSRRNKHKRGKAATQVGLSSTSSAPCIAVPACVMPSDANVFVTPVRLSKFAQGLMTGARLAQLQPTNHNQPTVAAPACVLLENSTNTTFGSAGRTDQVPSQLTAFHEMTYLKLEVSVIALVQLLRAHPDSPSDGSENGSRGSLEQSEVSSTYAPWLST